MYQKMRSPRMETRYRAQTFFILAKIKLVWFFADDGRLIAAAI